MVVRHSYRRFDPNPERLCGISEKFVEVAVALAGVSDFLTLDAKRCPRHCCEPFGSYVLLAVQAYAKAAFFDAEKRRAVTFRN